MEGIRVNNLPIAKNNGYLLRIGVLKKLLWLIFILYVHFYIHYYVLLLLPNMIFVLTDFF